METAEPQPATTIFARVVKPDRVQEFEAWLKGINQAVRRFDGCLGMDVIRPGEQDHLEYVIVLRFEDQGGFKRWLESPERAEWVTKSDDMTIGEPYIQEAHGLDPWFTLPGRQTEVHGPAKYKMVIVVFLSIFPLLLSIPPLVAPLLTFLPPVASQAIQVIGIVALMTYVVLPLMTRLFAFWLFGTRQGSRRAG